MNASSWRIWPIIAALFALLFIGWDIALVSNARAVQNRIGEQVDLLDGLSQLNGELDQLGLVHRVDVSAHQSNWPRELAALRQRVQQLEARHGAEPGMKALPSTLNTLLHAADSLHAEAMANDATVEQTRMHEAVFHLMMERAKDRVERTVRGLHELGLGAQTGLLSKRWDEAQTLLFLACMFAVVLALLVGMTRRLLVHSRQRSAELSVTSQRLEASNRELRETMLSKEEKEVMIKEIHHRVKNNLQIVRSLIRFQVDQVDDDRTKELFNECINRVGAMALVHEQTYLSKDLANIDVSTYLDRLVRDLVMAYNIRLELEMDVDIHVRTLGVDTLVPLGLLINEVVSNSFKHAFKGRTKGRIIVHLTGTEEGGLHLRVGDDGVGLPNSANGWKKPNSLGMELIHTLADQLNASIELLPVPGTQYELRSVPMQVRRRA